MTKNTKPINEIAFAAPIKTLKGTITAKRFHYSICELNQIDEYFEEYSGNAYKKPDKFIIIVGDYLI
jgi:hypothetical protein